MRTRILSVSFALLITLLALSLGCWAEETVADERKLTAEEADAWIDDFFEKQQKLTRISATLITRTKGKTILNPNAWIERLAFIDAKVPDRFLMVDRGVRVAGKPLPPMTKARKLLVDGTHIWEVHPQAPDEAGKPERLVERMHHKSAAGKGKRTDLASFLIGQAIASAKELRDEFEIAGFLLDEGAPEATYRFELKRRMQPAGNGAIPTERDEIVIWVRPETILPWKIRQVKVKLAFDPITEQMVPGKKEIEERELELVQTNLSNPPLPAYEPNYFWFGNLYKPGQMRVVESGKKIEQAQLEKELAAQKR